MDGGNVSSPLWRQLQGLLDVFHQKTRSGGEKVSEPLVNEETEGSWRGNLFESPKKRLQARWEQVSPSLKEKLHKYSPKALRDLLGEKETTYQDSAISTYEENVAAMEDCSQMFAERQSRYKQIAAFYLENSETHSPIVTQCNLPSTSQDNNLYLPLNTPSSHLSKESSSQPLTQGNLWFQHREESIPVTIPCEDDRKFNRQSYESEVSEGVSILSGTRSKAVGKPEEENASPPNFFPESDILIKERKPHSVDKAPVRCSNELSEAGEEPLQGRVSKQTLKTSDEQSEINGTTPISSATVVCIDERSAAERVPLETDLDNIGPKLYGEFRISLKRLDGAVQAEEDKKNLQSCFLESDFPVDDSKPRLFEVPSKVASGTQFKVSPPLRKGVLSHIEPEKIDDRSIKKQDAFVETFVCSFSENEDTVDSDILTEKGPSSDYVEFSSCGSYLKQIVREPITIHRRNFPVVVCENVSRHDSKRSKIDDSLEDWKVSYKDKPFPELTSSENFCSDTGTTDKEAGIRLVKDLEDIPKIENIPELKEDEIIVTKEIEHKLSAPEEEVAQICKDIEPESVAINVNVNKRDQTLPTIKEGLLEDVADSHIEDIKSTEEMATMPHIVVPAPDALHLRKSPVTVQEWVDHLPVKPKITEEPIEEPMDRAAMLRCEAAARLSREASVQSSSSLDSLLDARRPDPVEVLLNLGFGGSPGIDLENCRIPKRFLVPSKCKGGDWNEFLKRELLQAQNFECASLGFRGLSGPSHQRPSAIVANIMEKLRERTAPRPPPRSRFTSVARRVLSETSVLNKLNSSIPSTSSSVLTPDNRKFLDSQGKISPEVPRRRIILNQKSFIHKDGDLVEVEHAPLTTRDSASGLCSSKDSTHSDLVDSESEMMPSAEELLRKRRSSLQRQRKVQEDSDEENDLDSLKEENHIIVPEIKEPGKPFRRFKSTASLQLVPEDGDDIRGELVAEIENLSRKIQTAPREELAAILEPIKEICVKLEEL